MKLKDMIPGNKLDIQAYNELTQLLKSAKENKKTTKRQKKQILAMRDNKKETASAEDILTTVNTTYGAS